jgi:glycosyltransferase involved in cell wall biosynthesis
LLGEYSDLRLYKEKLMNGALYLHEPDKFDIQVKLPDRKPIAAFVGRLVKEKGILDFLQAIPMIVSKNPNVKILVVGTGILDDMVGRMVADLGWSDKVTWVKWIEPHKMPELLNKIKLLVVPSYEEGLPNIILEAMGCGTPVLASRAGGIPDIVKEGCTGFILSNITADTIAHDVDRAINSPCLEILTFNAKELIKQEYSLDASITRYEKIIEKVGDIHKS